MAYTIEHSSQAPLPPLKGGWVALPLLTTLGGIWASTPPLLTEAPATVAMALALVLGGWQPLWHTLTSADWATPLRAWWGWTQADPIPSWPYQQPGTPGAVLHRRLAQARAWWRGMGRKSLAWPIWHTVLALAVTLLLGAALGRRSLLLSLCFAALTELTVLWHEGEGRAGPLWTGLSLVGLPWLLGGLLVGQEIQTVISGLALALTIGLYAQPSWWALSGPALGAAFLVSQDHPMAAGWLLLLALPGLIVLAHRPDQETYRRAIGPWVLAMVVLVAWVL